MCNQREVISSGDYAVKYTASIWTKILAVLFSALTVWDFINLYTALSKAGFSLNYWYIYLGEIFGFVFVSIGLLSMLFQKTHKEKLVSSLHSIQFGFGIRIVLVLVHNCIQYYSYLKSAGMYYRTLKTYLINDGKIYDILTEAAVVLAMFFAIFFIQNIVNTIKRNDPANYVFPIMCGVFSVAISVLLVYTILGIFKAIGVGVTFENLKLISTDAAFLRLYATAFVGIWSAVSAFVWLKYANKINRHIIEFDDNDSENIALTENENEDNKTSVSDGEDNTEKNGDEE